MITEAELKVLLDSVGTCGPIKVGNMDEQPNILGVIFPYGGQASVGQFGVVGVGYEKPSIQFMFRGEPGDFEGPMTRARAAYGAVTSIQPGTLSGGTSEYLTVIAQQPPFSLGQDKNRRYEIVFNVYIEKQP